jgi:hypothetical protein
MDPIDDDPVVNQLFNEGLAVPTDPEPYARSAVGRFFKAVERKGPQGRTLLDAMTNLAKRKSDKHDEMANRLRQSPWFRNLPARSLIFWTYIKKPKGTDRLWALLEKYKVCRPRQGDEYIGVYEPFCHLYMSCLAEVMSEKIGAPPITHDAVYTDWITRLRGSQHRQASDAQTVLAHLQFPWPTPEQLRGVSIKRFLRFHRKYADERRRFREVILKFTQEIRDLDDKNQVKDAFELKANELRQSVTDLRKSLRLLNLQRLVGALSIGAPTSLVGIVALTGLTVSQPFATVGGLLIGLAGTLAKFQADRDRLLREPMYYADAVERAFAR